MKKSRTKAKKIVKLFSIMLVIIILCVASFLLTIYFSVNLDEDSVISQKSNIILYAGNNTEIVNDNISRYVKFDEISPNIINAFIALEDKRFYKHNGVDYYRTAGAMINNIKAGYTKEGGSTITQQLAKNTQLTNEKTYIRKIKEMKLARDIEKQYSKEEILEMYLNAIYFGNGIYGIDSACQTYFNKSTSEVTVAESAYLAGIVKSPKNYSPVNNLEKSTARKNLVLKLMFEQGYISESELETANNYIYQANEEANYDLVTPYYQNTIIESSKLLNIDEKALMTGGYKIFTYYDEAKQNILYTAYLSGEYDNVNEQNNVASYATMLSDNSTGGITAYFCNFGNSLYNFKRQPASTLKPVLVYAPALESNTITSATPVLDEPININGYSPNNYANNYLGWIDIQTAISESSNVVSVKTLNEVGIDYSKKIAAKMGINFSENDNGLSLALGGMEYGVNFCELSSAYMCLANMGEYKQNTFIRAIYDKNGSLVYSNNQSATQVISKETAYLINDMLCKTVDSGTARKLSDMGITVAGKTGTNGYLNSANNLDSWCMSYTPEVTLCVWYGDMDNSEQNAVSTTGGSYPALLSRFIYKSLNLKNREFSIPDGIVSLDVDNYALQNAHKLYLTNMFTPAECVETVYFNEKNAPTEFSPYFDFEKFYFKAVTDEAESENLYNHVNISYNVVEPYQTLLFRQNMFTGEITAIDGVEEKNGEVSYTDVAEEFCVYNYYIEFYYGDKRLSYSPNSVVFT